MSYRADRLIVTAHRDGWTHKQTQALTVPEGHNRPRVKTSSTFPRTNNLILISFRISQRQICFNSILVSYISFDSYKVKLCIMKSCYTPSVCWHNCILIWAPIPVTPTDANIHIAFSDTPYTTLDASVAKLLANCTSLPGPVTRYTDLDLQCQAGAIGRYVYAYTQGVVGNNRMDVLEIAVYGYPTPLTRMYVAFALVGLFCAWDQPMRWGVTMKHLLSLAEPSSTIWKWSRLELLSMVLFQWIWAAVAKIPDDY